MKLIRSTLYKLYIKLKERNWGGTKYLFYDNHSQDLLIMFAGFATGEKRLYNYVKSLGQLNIDRLYILDTWGYKGSYYMYENGSNHPMKLTDKVIEKYISRKNYRYVFTGGTSKGGTAALYFGLKHDVDAIFSGACQYNLGTYLTCTKHLPIFYGMMGKEAGTKELDTLNRQLPALLEEKKDTTTIVHLLYSKLEPTYEEEIIDLKKDLEDANIPFKIQEESFQEHDQVGKYFPSYVISCISQLTRNE